jgi:hypothetical protein
LRAKLSNWNYLTKRKRSRKSLSKTFHPLEKGSCCTGFQRPVFEIIPARSRFVVPKAKRDLIRRSRDTEGWWAFDWAHAEVLPRSASTGFTAAGRSWIRLMSLSNQGSPASIFATLDWLDFKHNDCIIQDMCYIYRNASIVVGNLRLDNRTAVDYLTTRETCEQ